MPLPVSILCRGGAALLSALPALRGRVSGRAIQYRVLRAADPYGSAGDIAECRRVHPYAGRRAPLQQSSGAGASPVVANAPTAAGPADESRGEGYLLVPL